ncbi:MULTISPECIES: metallophosphoesterase family protein [Paenibacillus]|uniref:metallophosphoesterase family protein n=1 Tax=Paenibacillus TaxID=44249 RepID=UPI0009543BB3|nr:MULTISPECIES: metallophosphoesterase [Paenibacillus]SIR54981.1 3',5'-cyclic AMP phosphodiesterase CpdA [Paenibacillus sp. RU4X]SIR63493.1 3',5'-cyclic AMP phosphodiesterase CpdA [Paenibacillus sp. RU4T]
MTVRLIVMGDLHYHECDRSVPGLHDAHAAFYSGLLDEFLEADADLHISLGDLTNYGTAEELRQIYGLLRSKPRNFIHVLGNHDLYAQTRAEVLDLSGQQRYHAFDAGHAVLAFLDTAKEQDYEDWGGWVDPEQLDWLEEIVIASGDRPLLVFGHHPVYATTARSETDKGSIHPDIDMWSILRKKKGVGVYFNGHTHVDSIAVRGQWSFVQLSACLDVPSFRIVDVEPEMIAVRAVEVTDEEAIGGLPIIHRHMRHFTPTLGAKGLHRDRELAIPLKDSVLPG